MPSIINTNTMSLNAVRNLNRSQLGLQRSMQRLSSGLRINSARDDAAGIGISSRLSAQIRGSNQAARNANDGISLAQTAEGALAESENILLRMRELSVQAANDSNSGADRASLQREVAQLQEELNNIARNTQFGDKKLLDGSLSNQQFQIGANQFQTVSVTIGSAEATDIGSQALPSNGSSTTAPAATSTLPAANTIAAQTLTIAGSVGTSAATVNLGDTAYAISNSVNAASGATGVTATARTTAQISALNPAGNVSLNLYGSNGVAVSISAVVTSTADLSALADAINGRSGSTGISATASGGTVSLVQAQGYDISIENFLNSGGGTVNYAGDSGGAVALTSGGADSTRSAGLVSFSSSEAYSVTTTAAGTLFAGLSSVSTLSSIANISVSSAANANAAIAAVDGAIGFIANIRGRLGAIQNRLESTVSNLMTTSENMSAARSRIQDADYAAETMNLTMGQILQQAGTAMLSQANAAPQSVLSLLQSGQ